ncbi:MULTISPECIES: Xaa-Pro dipeptidyl-peptidase [Streptomycetaceae]|uniref:Xaa-Pro dipeptidyl-peptidase n=1 Tax=Streptantibioticus cattleyicolor (strain ATCC 35852 / DSM 46488 / JCM 4925 / NBRC 14057 / NRRL 8057) TaxID=1003195 RepID=F8K1G9_STREN|nr:Xaa-Pro dipeptidyl-peptidase [Streptantibioticus cattleyicolor]AEW97463.1 putative X-Pro dipeptidyl-peptidase [Streptantibioticus cattleyicolor NRRL 8057 = DSM 46488]MYS61898.1 Xaa-Pro dipeptidyl-peptidase [Streptomyces sp. SID5468]CCB77784.1 putative Xaa-Pro dipeptidyl-peptidase [Streptantibioticus cattleyicolor NRRL 8057 = DSM 46488]
MAVAVLVTTLLAAFTAPAGAVPPPRHPTESRPVYSYAGAVRETVWVDTGLDGNHDGRPDRVAADIIRPAEPARAGVRIPVIMDASPYYSCCGRGNESQLKTYDNSGRPVQFPLYYDNYFVPRGYAVVLVDLAGTNRSDGCVDVGGPSDVTSAKAVIDWLNGRATGHSARSGGTTVRATWANGSVGMIGKSWDGTIANGVAATGVAGLKTIVPISAISSWYDYYFDQGAALYDGGPDELASAVEDSGDARTCGAQQQALRDGAPRDGDWTALWQRRDYVADAAKVRASVFVVHGMQDLNVRTKHFGQWWDALAAHGVPRKIWLSQTGHVDPFDYRRAAWVETLHQWFDHYLLGVDNGIDRAPMADVERTPDHWTTDAHWPAPGTSATTVALAAGSTAGLGTLSATGPATGTETYTDDPAESETDWSAAADRATGDKVSFTTGALRHDLRISGGGSVTLTATPSTTSAHLSAVLVDLGPATIRDYSADGEGITTLTTRSCWGASTAGDSACFLDTAADTMSTGYTVFSRGWADLGHYDPSLHGVALTPGTPYTITIKLAATDHVVPAGHRLALIVGGTDKGLITAPGSTPDITLDLARSSASLPLVGGLPALLRVQGPAAVAHAVHPAGRQLSGMRRPAPAWRGVADRLG